MGIKTVQDMTKSFEIGEVVSCRGMPASIEEIKITVEAVMYLVKSFWFNAWVRQDELKKY